MADIRPVTPTFAVAPQIEPADMAEIAAAGFALVIDNRPDSEIPAEIGEAEMRRSAEAAGLAFVAIPISSGPRPDQIDLTIQALSEATGPVLAYCRSGTRSITAWALAQAAAHEKTADELVQLAAKAGYDLGATRPILETLNRT
jgi:uncharacterized protein (TIGR01244 family)